MIRLEIVNKPKALLGKTLKHRVECYAFEFNSKDNTIAIYENFSQWYDETPAFYFIEVVKFTGAVVEED